MHYYQIPTKSWYFCWYLSNAPTQVPTNGVRHQALTDTFIRQVKHISAPAGEKYTDGQGLFLLVKSSGKYWRLNYRFSDQQKTLALGVL
jgi:hypothetical protein